MVEKNYISHDFIVLVPSKRIDGDATLSTCCQIGHADPTWSKHWPKYWARAGYFHHHVHNKLLTWSTGWLVNCWSLSTKSSIKYHSQAKWLTNGNNTLHDSCTRPCSPQRMIAIKGILSDDFIFKLISDPDSYLSNVKLHSITHTLKTGKYKPCLRFISKHFATCLNHVTTAVINVTYSFDLAAANNR